MLEEFQWYSKLLHDIETGVNSGPTFSVYTVTYYSNHGRNQKIANGTESRKDFFWLNSSENPSRKGKSVRAEGYELRVCITFFRSLTPSASSPILIFIRSSLTAGIRS